VQDVVTVPDDAIAEAALLLLRDEHLLVEWSGAVGLAALLAGAVPPPGPRRSWFERRQHRAARLLERRPPSPAAG